MRKTVMLAIAVVAAAAALGCQCMRQPSAYSQDPLRARSDAYVAVDTGVYVAPR